ncbi:serine C-palmitoyltransferase [Naegleria gruberi]|uniref:serine C-palmitoyltransferase n=1 Tax=Naegleria gruberi TaxID=5762 RepID=D2V0W1_NAEGR|nr:serine C-palmitoyltransferase [Naegleria gruberi]EFC49582.1 serine C-palmitoyltransferase [Naegleria gruberi]|eukprot:XP_002682326.1 serine C-palmitoyltransferase [Naegleria gruberi strain NEG-M]
MTHCDISSWVLITTYLNYAVLILLGQIRDFFHELFIGSIHQTPKGFAPLVHSYEDLYTRRLYRRICDCWNRPISSRPGAYIDVMKRVSNDYNKTIQITDDRIHCLNLASYNYLGFADSPKHVLDDVLKSIDQYGPASASAYGDFGYSKIHKELEDMTAKFVGKEDSIVFSMGFATNSTTIPLLAPTPDCLIISDQLNHTSIVAGVRSTGGAKVTVFKHNDMDHLEKIVRKSIIEGQPVTHRPWKKIIIIVEGIYSMEGEIVNLKRAVEIKKKYGCYLYVDEAHSIGALGKNGRGVCDYCGVSPADVDILMGTFTKSFGSVGGYIAADKEVITYLRKNSYGLVYGSSLPIPCAQQALSALKVITGDDGTDIGKTKLFQLNDTSNYLREGLKKLGFEVISDVDSPVIITMLYNPAKMPAFSRMSLEQGIAVVVVGAPACDTLCSRVRFCVSAAHTREDVDKALKKLDVVGTWTGTKYKVFESQLVNDLYQLVM